MGIMWEFAKNQYLYIEQPVLMSIRKYIQLGKHSTEAGGLLMGYFRGKHVHITELTEPMTGDVRARHRFERRDPRHIEILNRKYTDSDGFINLIGEWHTHPEPHPTPSPIDRSEWMKIQIARKGLRSFFLIAGEKSLWLSTASGSNLEQVAPDQV